MLDETQSNLTETEIKFLSESIDLMVLYGENLILLSKELFDNYGLVVDAKRVYFFVSAVRSRIKIGITRVIHDISANRIERKLSNVFGRYSKNLRGVVESEVSSIQNAVIRDAEAVECWEAYKVLLLELGFTAINKLQIVSQYEADNLATSYNQIKQVVTMKARQLVGAMSVKSPKFFSARLIVNTYVSPN